METLVKMNTSTDGLWADKNIDLKPRIFSFLSHSEVNLSYHDQFKAKANTFL